MFDKKLGILAASAISIATNGCMFYGKENLLGQFNARNDGLQPSGVETIICAENETDIQKRQQIVEKKVTELLKDKTPSACPSGNYITNPNGPIINVIKGGTKAENTNTLCQNYYIVRGDCKTEK
jgi:hypothetical protein